MTSERDEPEYGERATPEEQQRAIRDSGGVQEWQRRAAIPPPHERTTEAHSAGTGGPYTINRLATLVLLGVGLVAVIQSAFAYLDLGPTIQTLYAQQGIGDYTVTDLTRAIGISLIISHALVWALTTWVSFRFLARNRTAWWIPLIGALISFIIMATLLAVLLLADPAFRAHLGAA